VSQIKSLKTKLEYRVVLHFSSEFSMGVPWSARYVRFGPFQLDLRAAELRRHGIKVRVPDQSIKILAMLIEHPGDVVTREELHQRLWPNGTIVEFDRSINAAVQRLRQALEDSASTPRYIETLPRLGYRFVAPVVQAPAQDATPLYVEPESRPPSEALNNMNDVKIDQPDLNEESRSRAFRSMRLPPERVRRIIEVSGITVGALSIVALSLIWWSSSFPVIQQQRHLSN
jgi:DNA-binding winged helix-turn-helix (wHTH) protein